MPLQALAQSAAESAKLVGKIEERQLDIRPDSGERLLGWVQGPRDLRQDLTTLSAFLPKGQGQGQTVVCLKARNRDGTYVADGQLSAPSGNDAEIPVDVPRFPEVATSKGLEKSRPRDLGILFAAQPCQDPKSPVYPASFGTRGERVTAVLNLGVLRGDPQAKLVEPDITGSCERLAGRSKSFNVVCTFDLPRAHPGGRMTLRADFSPVGNPQDTVEFTVWTAPVQR